MCFNADTANNNSEDNDSFSNNKESNTNSYVEEEEIDMKWSVDICDYSKTKVSFQDVGADLKQ
jgi:hypothetical protein